MQMSVHFYFRTDDTRLYKKQSNKKSIYQTTRRGKGGIKYEKDFTIKNLKVFPS